MNLLERIKIFFLGRKPIYWRFFDCKMKGDIMHCKMKAIDFDKIATQDNVVIPIIDGKQVTFLSTPAYPIIIERTENE